MVRMRSVIAGAAAAALVAGCGSTKDSCPTTAAYPKATANVSSLCSASGGQIQINVPMCEACSHTAPSCAVDVVSASTRFLDTTWEVCTDNSSCAAQSCGQAACVLSLSPGTYTIATLSPSQTGNSQFTLNWNGTAVSCSGSI